MTDASHTQSTHNDPELDEFILEQPDEHEPPFDPDPEADLDASADASTPAPAPAPDGSADAPPTPARSHKRTTPATPPRGAPPRTGRAGFEIHRPSLPRASHKLPAVPVMKHERETLGKLKELRKLCEAKAREFERLGLAIGKLQAFVEAHMGPQKRRVHSPKKSAKKSGGGK